MILDKFAFLLPGLPALGLAVVVGASLLTYEAPTYGDGGNSDNITADVSDGGATTETATIGKGSFELEDGVYNGTGVGYSGNTVVNVTISDKTITAIDIVSEEDTEAFFNRAKAGVIPEILEKQSYDVDSVSGATYSSRGIKNAVKNAITGEEDTSTRGDGGSSASSDSTDLSDITEGTFEDGTYTGSAYGFSGTTTVRVTVENNKITKIEVISYGDSDSYFNRAKAVIDEMVSGNTTNVDTVSGATYSSKGIINAVRNALGLSTSGSSGSSSGNNSSGSSGSASISSSDDPDTLTDGTYTGTASGSSGGYNGGTTTVSVTISGGKITAIEVTSNQDTAQYFNKAKSTIINNIIANQSTNVDAVSGATYSSRGIINAVRNALQKASGSSSDSSDSVYKDALQAAITAAEAIKNQDAYTDSTWNALTGALASAKTVYAMSGATQTEVDDQVSALTKAMKALKTRTGSEDDANTVYADGTYTGTAECEGYDYTVTVTVTVENNKITSCTASASGMDSANQSYFDSANASVPGAIVSSQSADVDTVSGATRSSNAIMEAVANALAKARTTAAVTEEVTVDRTALVEAIESANAITDESAYTPSTWSAFRDARTTARAVNAIEGASQSDIDSQTSALNNAVSALAERADKTDLESTIDTITEQIKTLTESDFTESSWQNLQDALNNAQIVDADEDAVQSDADGARQTLQNAYDNLGEEVYTYWVTTQCTDGEDGEYTFNYWIKTTVTVQGGRITGVKAESDDIDEGSKTYFDRAVNGTIRRGVTYTSVLDQMVDKQSAEVDVVSSATYSSNAIINGAKEALSNAAAEGNYTAGETN